MSFSYFFNKTESCVYNNVLSLAVRVEMHFEAQENDYRGKVSEFHVSSHV